jgi:cardiolipin synthase
METSSKKIFTIPNVISFIRILLVPVFAMLYIKGHLVWALVALVLSSLSDLIDGKVARRFNMVSELGKMLDPVADKVTQITLAVLMFIKFHAAVNTWMVTFSWIFLAFIGKEVLMLLIAIVMLSLKKRPAAAEIYGKAATVVFFVVMIVLVLAAPEVGILAAHWALPQLVVVIMVCVSLVMTIVSFASYIPDTYRKLFNKEKKPKNK